ELSPVDTNPAKVPKGARNRTPPCTDAHREAEPETLPVLGSGIEDRSGEAIDPRSRRQVVRCHICDGLARHEAHTVELAAIQEELAEPRVVRRGRYHPSTPRKPVRAVTLIRHRRTLARGRVDLRLRDAPVLFRLLNPKARIVHLQGLQNTLVREP